MTQEKIMWGRVALAVIVIVVVAAAGAFVLLRRSPAQEGQEPTGEEYAWVQYTASFKLLSTEDNGPVENLLVIFSYPRYIPEPFENAADTPPENMVYVGPDPFWENIRVTYIPEGNNAISPVFTPQQLPGRLIFTDSDKYYYHDLMLWITEFLAGDEVIVETSFMALRENAARLTLRSYPYTHSIGTIQQILEEKTLGVKMNLELNIAGKSLERYERTTLEKSRVIFLELLPL